MNNYTIGSLARAAGVGVETIRYYQRRGLLPEPARGLKGGEGSGVRRYGEAERARLEFIRRAQGLGFSLEEIGELLALDEETDRVQARALAQAKLTLIESRIAQLAEMRAALRQLVDCCLHTASPDPCPILHTLADAGPTDEADRQASPRKSGKPRGGFEKGEGEVRR